MPQVESHLAPKAAEGACARTVLSPVPGRDHLTHHVQVLHTLN